MDSRLREPGTRFMDNDGDVGEVLRIICDGKYAVVRYENIKGEHRAGPFEFDLDFKHSVLVSATVLLDPIETLIEAVDD